MCLRKAEKINLEKDLVVYKVFRYNKDGDYVSPFVATSWKVGEQKSIDAPWPSFLDEENTVIGGYAFHSFQRRESAWALADLHGYLYPSDKYIVAKCIIPKETLYVFKGYSEVGLDIENGYASHDLKFVEVVETLEYRNDKTGND